MIIPFTAKPSEDAIVDGSVELLQASKEPYEAVMEADGWSYHLIFGHQVNGWFICIPNWSIGAELSHPNDYIWNKSSLKSAGVDSQLASCISTALKAVSQYL